MEGDRPNSVLLQLQGVNKSYGLHSVLKNVDLDVGASEFLAVLGPSGSGKTTILRVIGGFESIDSGRLTFDGIDLAPVPINRRPFNTVFQDYALFHHMRVRDNIGYGLKVRGTNRATIARRVTEVMETVGLGAFGDRYPAELSGGQRQRVALARAIVCEPRLILLDEPLAALDVNLRGQMQRFLKDMQRRLGITFLFVTHDQEEAIVLADRVVVVREGRIEQIGTPDEVYLYPATRFVADFFGENNIISGKVAWDVGGLIGVETTMGLLQAEARAWRPRLGEPVLLAFRPERLHIAGDVAAANAVTATLSDIRFLGPNRMLELRPDAVPADIVRVRELANASPAVVGQKFMIRWAAADTTLIRPDAHD